MDSPNLEEKKERFKTVASRRVQKILDGMDNLSRCSNKRNYEYSEEDIKKMFKVLNDRYALLKISFSSGSKSSKQTFEF